ncbi:hypothetical protein Tco_1427026, partial [Tanacetum coccineum]
MKALKLQFSSVSTEALGFESMFSIPSSTINLLKVGSSRGLVKISCRIGLLWIAANLHFSKQACLQATDKHLKCFFCPCCIQHSQSLSILLGQDLNILETEDQDWEYHLGMLTVRFISDPIIPLYRDSFTALPLRSVLNMLGGTI